MKKTIGLISGRFDLLHPGHIYFIQTCSQLCDELVVAIPRDKLTTKLKGIKPILTGKQRMYMIENIKGVYISIFEDDKLPPYNLKKVIDIFEPDFYFTNEDNINLEKYKKLFKEKGVKIITLERNNEGMFNISTTKIKEKIKND